MSYGIVTVRITGGQSVKIQTMGGYIELEANHRLVMCNYPLKKLAEKLPPLQIPGLGKWILQTDASDEYWVAALFE